MKVYEINCLHSAAARIQLRQMKTFHDEHPDLDLLAVVTGDQQEADPEIMNTLMQLSWKSDHIYVLFGTEHDFVNTGAPDREQILTEREEA